MTPGEKHSAVKDPQILSIALDLTWRQEYDALNTVLRKNWSDYLQKNDKN